MASYIPNRNNTDTILYQETDQGRLNNRRQTGAWRLEVDVWTYRVLVVADAKDYQLPRFLLTFDINCNVSIATMQVDSVSNGTLRFSVQIQQRRFRAPARYNYVNIAKFA